MEDVRFTPECKAAGELACRSLSSKAYSFYCNTAPLAVYEVGLRWKHYYIRGVINKDYISFEEMQELFEELADDCGLSEESGVI
ncbi:MAG: hypothetical protein IJM37_10495 [Lachnospiraceae bacterium]|nr:hypothetical protein [Lachnospiraceae bacterium]